MKTCAVREAVRAACKRFPQAREVRRNRSFAPDEIAIDVEPFVRHRIDVEEHVSSLGGTKRDLRVFYRREFNLLLSVIRDCRHHGRVQFLDEERRAVLFVLVTGELLENELSLLRQHLPIARKRAH